MMSERRKKRFLKNTSGFFHAGEELILAVPYMNGAGVASGLKQLNRRLDAGPTASVRRMAEMAGVSGQEPERTSVEQEKLDAIGSMTGDTGFPPVAGWVAFTRGRILVFPTTQRLGWPSELAVVHPIKSVVDIEIRQLMHGNVSAVFKFGDGSSARANVRQDGDKLLDAYNAAKGEIGREG